MNKSILSLSISRSFGRSFGRSVAAIAMSSMLLSGCILTDENY